ncbi:MAG: deoxyribodipyrimidine photo-lyase [Betaproteobacteria bacterium]|nr:MAG: deoxyribodipyrimidine photo-lyase [Betaproteobacteria bacterium]
MTRVRGSGSGAPARGGGERTGALVWFRRDLRDHDHAALAHALADGGPVWCAFVFDRGILDALPSPRDRRVAFIHASLVELDAALRRRGGGLIVRHDFAREAIPRLADALRVAAVYANRDVEPAALDRDAAVAHALSDRGIALRTFKDHVVFERDEILSKAGTPFTVYTPYRNAWLARLAPPDLASHDVRPQRGALARPPAEHDRGIPALETMGFVAADLAAIGVEPGMRGARARFADFAGRIERYGEARDFPAVDGVSHLSVHLRFGTISVRTLAAEAHARSLRPRGDGAAKWLSELVWREFYSQLLWHFPHVVRGAFRREYDALAFENDPARFAAWCEGRTGYPLVDAAMRQLNATGYMHNRLRMVAASFLVKDLLVDWRAGERVFAERLIDFDLASNNGGWQWAASTGCDAQPWFRIFNPVTQSERFDPDGTFIRRHVPEVAALDAGEIHAPWKVPPAIQQAKGVEVGREYPAPIVDHAAQRAKALALYEKVRSG